jgi:hypothetical protein
VGAESLPERLQLQAIRCEKLRKIAESQAAVHRNFKPHLDSRGVIAVPFSASRQ